MGTTQEYTFLPVSHNSQATSYRKEESKKSQATSPQVSPHPSLSPSQARRDGSLAAAAASVRRVAEILLRLPSHPTRLLRASLVCRRWRRLLRDPAFLSRFRAFHRTPPVLGLFKSWLRHCCAFLPVGEPADRVPAGRFSLPDPDSWFHLGCRHGRVLLRSRPGWLHLLVWDPLTGHRRCVRVQRLPRYVEACHATVLGDQSGLDRRQGSFRVAFVLTGGGRASACLFSSVICRYRCSLSK
ncbi:unnamed protein product [Urochloa humidicola]